MHYPLLNIYRYFDALIVCISHYILHWNKSVYFEFTSILGVELFFILSGFVLAPQILRLEKNENKAEIAVKRKSAQFRWKDLSDSKNKKLGWIDLGNHFLVAGIILLAIYIITNA